ncbi:hypothetical protein SESBI_27483 [Sesbania bispinosa]|nr:hypothetical protein SESBI_27483 [Sesbania bispinosa]
MKGGSSCSVEKKIDVTHLRHLHYHEGGDVDVTQRSCNFFQWADDGVTEETNMCYEHTLEDLRAKNAKLKSKLVAERKVRIVKLGFVVFSWSVSFAVLGYCAVKCNCNMQ